MPDTGFRSPGTAANADRSGGVAWSNPGNIVSSNNVRAIADLDEVASDWLRATNFGFTIPSDATIDGIEIAVERHHEGGGNPIQDQQCFLRKSTGQVGSDWAATATNWPTSDGTATYGGATSLFGTTWTPAEINNSAFGLDLSARKNPTSGVAREARVDHIQIKVYYTEAAGEPVDTPVNVTAHLRLARRITKAASTAKTGRLKFAPSLATALSFGRAFTAHMRFGRSLTRDTGKVARAFVRTGPRLSRASGWTRAAHLRLGRTVTKSTATAKTAHQRFAATLDSIKSIAVLLTAYLRLASVVEKQAGLSRVGYLTFAKPASQAQTWDTGFSVPEIAYSDGDLTAANTQPSGAGFPNVRSSTTRSSGKLHAEITWNDLVTAGSGSAVIGLATPGFPNSTAPGNAASGEGSWTLFRNGSAVHDGSITGGGPTLNDGDVARLDVDFDSGDLWLGGPSGYHGGGDPAAGTDPTFTIPPGSYHLQAGCFRLGGNDNLTVNFGASAFNYVVPAGFQSWAAGGSESESTTNPVIKAVATAKAAYLKFATTFDALKSALVTLTAYVRLSARRTHSIGKPLSAHLTLARSLTKAVSRTRTAAIKFAAALVAANAFSRAMTAHLRVAPALTRHTGKPLSAAIEFAGISTKAVSLSRAVYVRFRLSLARAATVIVNLARWIIRDAAAVAFSARHAVVSVWTVADTAAVWTVRDAAVATWAARDSSAVTWAASDRAFEA